VAVLDTIPTGRLKAGEHPAVLFDVTLNGFERTRSLFKLAFEPPFVAATLCGFFALLLAGWGAYNRFGAARRQGREFALGKRALVDNQAGLIRMARREPRMARPYVQLVRDQVAHAIGAPRDLAPEALDAFIDRVGANRGAADTLAALRAAADSVRDTLDLSRLAGRLHTWRLEMTRES